MHSRCTTQTLKWHNYHDATHPCHAKMDLSSNDLYLRLATGLFRFRSIKMTSLQEIWFSKYWSYHTSGQVDAPFRKKKSAEHTAGCVWSSQLMQGPRAWHGREQSTRQVWLRTCWDQHHFPRSVLSSMLGRIMRPIVADCRRKKKNETNLHWFVKHNYKKEQKKIWTDLHRCKNVQKKKKRVKNRQTVIYFKIDHYNCISLKRITTAWSAATGSLG